MFVFVPKKHLKKCKHTFFCVWFIKKELKCDMLPSLCSLDSRTRWTSSSSTCNESMLSFSFSFSDFSLLFSGSSTPSEPIWKMTQVLFNFPFTAQNKSHAAQAAWQIWVPFRHKAIVQLSASYHFPLNNKKWETKKANTFRRGRSLFFPSSLFRPFLLARKKDSSTLHTKPIIHGDIFIDRNNTYHTVCVPLSFRSIYSGSHGRQLGPIHPRSGLCFLTSSAEPVHEGSDWRMAEQPQGVHREHSFPGGTCCLCAVPQ